MAVAEEIHVACRRHDSRECRCEGCRHEIRVGAGPGRAFPEGLYDRFVEALAEALDIREMETGMHSRRAACHTQVLARRFVTSSERLRQIYWGSLLHDIGKIGVPDSILLKHSQLDAEEWALMRPHPALGHRIVANLPDFGEAAEIVLCHEERHDGRGYPQGLKGEEIPLGARLFAVIDTLDAMTSDRPYRKAMSFDEAKQEILRMRGSQFHPEAVEAFVLEEPTLREMVAAKCTLPAGQWPAR